MKTSELTGAALDRAIKRFRCGYRISTPSPSPSLPWEAYWPGRSSPVAWDEDLRYFATLRQAKEWILKKSKSTKKEMK
jgi:hypothetical protein